VSGIAQTRKYHSQERLVRTCPKKVTNTVTKLNSMVLANRAKRVDAVDGVILPPECMWRPYLGSIKARTNQMPEKMVEYIESITMDIDSQLSLELCISCSAGQPSKSPMVGR